MKHLFLLFTLLSFNLYALTLDEIIHTALAQHPTLESIRHKIDASQSNINASNQFSNPTLTYSQNTIDANEPMSQKSIAFGQTLPYFGKRDSTKSIATANKDILNENLLEMKTELVFSIKKQAYIIWELENIYKSITEYETLTKQNIKLSESYTSTSDNQHMGIMSAELTLSELRIQLSSLQANIISAYAQLSYLTSFEISTLDIQLSISDMKSIEYLRNNLSNNHRITLKQKEIKKSQALIKNIGLSNYPDINLQAAYSYRENFEDYLSFGISMRLPIYKTENEKEAEMQNLALSSHAQSTDVKLLINSEFKTAYAQMKSASEIYHIINDSALPQLEHMFELSSSSISTGGDLFKYIDILIKKLKLEQKSIRAVSNFNTQRAKISALNGELK